MIKSTPEEREKLRKRLDYEDHGPKGGPWGLSHDLFGKAGVDINDFEIENYTYFLDNVRSLEDLLKGLEQLSPLAEDALEIARCMNYQDFHDFKIALAYDRRMEDSRMPERYYSLVLPKWFVPALIVTQEAQVPLGCALIRLIELE